VKTFSQQEDGFFQIALSSLALPSSSDTRCYSTGLVAFWNSCDLWCANECTECVTTASTFGGLATACKCYQACPAATSTPFPTIAPGDITPTFEYGIFVGDSECPPPNTLGFPITMFNNENVVPINGTIFNYTFTSIQLKPYMEPKVTYLYLYNSEVNSIQFRIALNPRICYRNLFNISLLGRNWLSSILVIRNESVLVEINKYILWLFLIILTFIFNF